MGLLFSGLGPGPVLWSRSRPELDILAGAEPSYDKYYILSQIKQFFHNLKEKIGTGTLLKSEII